MLIATVRAVVENREDSPRLPRHVGHARPVGEVQLVQGPAGPVVIEQDGFPRAQALQGGVVARGPGAQAVERLAARARLRTSTPTARPGASSYRGSGSGR